MLKHEAKVNLWVKIDHNETLFTAQIGCIHDDMLYLKNHSKGYSHGGSVCTEHTTNHWVCYLISSPDGDYWGSNGSKGHLKSLCFYGHPRLIKK